MDWRDPAVSESVGQFMNAIEDAAASTCKALVNNAKAGWARRAFDERFHMHDKAFEGKYIRDLRAFENKDCNFDGYSHEEYEGDDDDEDNNDGDEAEEQEEDEEDEEDEEGENDDNASDTKNEDDSSNEDTQTEVSDCEDSGTVPEGMYEVNAIHDQRKRYKGRGKNRILDGFDYLIEWDDYPRKEDWTWIKDRELDSPQLVQTWNELNAASPDEERKVVRKIKTEGELRSEFIAEETRKLEESAGRGVTTKEYDDIVSRSFLVSLGNPKDRRRPPRP